MKKVFYNKYIHMCVIFMILIVPISIACTPGNPSTEHLYNYKSDTTVQKIWFDGRAELATYKLVQPRYGENRPGHVVMITVTEDFSKSKHVKLDNAMSDLDDVIKVLKTVFVRRFITGVYDYSLMTSTFVPFLGYYKNESDIYPLKVTHSTQDWCGQSFTQLNNRDGRYDIETRSYYEIEGDHVNNIIRTHSADGLFSIGRVNPNKLPVGEFKLLPPLSELHLNHWTTKPLIVNGKLTHTDKYYSYTVVSKGKQLRMSITFRRAKPYIIQGFYYETEGKRTTFSLLKLQRQPYWGQNHIKDESLRKELDVPWLNKK